MSLSVVKYHSLTTVDVRLMPSDITLTVDLTKPIELNDFSSTSLKLSSCGKYLVDTHDLHVYNVLYLNSDLRGEHTQISVPHVDGTEVMIAKRIYMALTKQMNTEFIGEGPVVDPHRHYTLICEDGETLPSKALLSYGGDCIDLNVLRRRLRREANEKAELFNEALQQADEDFYAAVKTINRCPHTESLLFV